jgi:hypothetical protein
MKWTDKTNMIGWRDFALIDRDNSAGKVALEAAR